MSESVSLVLRVRSGGVSAHHAAVVTPTGRLKPFWGLVGGRPTHLPTGIYYLRYRTEGKRVWERIGTDPDRAFTVKLQREHQLAGTKLGLEAPRPIATKPTPIAVVAAPLPVAEADKPPRVKIINAVDVHARRIMVRRGKKTGRSYWQHLMMFVDSCTKTYLDELTRDDVERFIAYLRGQGKAAKTIHNRLVTLKAFLRREGQDGKIVQFEDAPAILKKLPRVYSREELVALLAASSATERLVWEVFVATGLRESEVSFLCWHDLDLAASRLNLHAKPEWGFLIKDRTERSIPLPKTLAASLAKWKAASLARTGKYADLVFPTASGKPEGHFLRLLKEVAFRAGLNCGRCVNRAGKSCTHLPVCGKWQLHSFRRTAATRWHRVGLKDVRTIQHWLGHSDLETTQRYLSPDQGDANGGMDMAFDDLAA